MMKKAIFALVAGCSIGIAGCDSSPTDNGRPQYDVHTRTTTTAAPTTQAGQQIGDPCDPETYSGPYRCIPDPNKDGGYIVAY